MMSQHVPLLITRTTDLLNKILTVNYDQIEIYLQNTDKVTFWMNAHPVFFSFSTMSARWLIQCRWVWIVDYDINLVRCMRTIACWINCERLRIFRYLYNNSFLNLSLTNRLTPSRPSFSGTNVDEAVDDDSLIVFKVGRRQALNSDDDQLVALYIRNFHFFKLH